MNSRADRKIPRRLLLGGIVSAAYTLATPPILRADAPARSVRPSPRPPASRRPPTDGAADLIAAAGLGGRVAYVVANARTGQILESGNPVLRLPPASVLKTITAQYALESLGPAHRFKTRVVATGPVVDGRLEGDLVLAGGGDPMLDTEDLASMAKALLASGLRGVSGRFYVYPGPLPSVPQIDPDQPDYLGYNPAVSGLNLNFNRVYFEWKRAKDGYDISLDARSANYRPEVAMTRMQIVDRRGPVYTYDEQGGVETWTVARRALGSKGGRWLPVRQPEIYAGEVLQALVSAEGLVLPTPKMTTSAPHGIVLAENDSMPLQRVLRSMLYYSTNVIAEVAGMGATVARGLHPATLAESADEMAHWAHERLDMRKPMFFDHSGLNDENRVAATDLVSALLRIGPDSTLATILKDVKIRDAQGRPQYDGPVSVKAKSGTLNFVSNLAGFITQEDGDEALAFAILAADVERHAAIPVQNRERPPGARAWTSRAHSLQHALLRRWSERYLG